MAAMITPGPELPVHEPTALTLVSVESMSTRRASNTALVKQVGADVVITLSGGNAITVLSAVKADVVDNMVWEDTGQNSGGKPCDTSWKP